MLHTAEIIYAVCNTPRRFFRNLETWKLFLRCVHTAKIVSGVCNTLLRLSPRYVVYHGDNFVIGYLGEIETEFKNKKGLNHEKMEGENLVTHYL